MRNFLTLCAAAIGMLIAGSSHAGASEADLPLQAERNVTFTTREGTFMSVDISPDGRTIVFDLLGDLYRMPVAGGRAEPLTGGPAYDQYPRFAPDGRQIAFVSDRNGASNLWLIGSDGGNAHQLSRFSPVDRPALLLMTPTWEPDGSAVIASAFTIYTLAMTLRRFALDGTAKTLELDYGRTPRPVSPAISSDGRQLYYSEALRCQRNLAGSVYSAILPCSQIHVWDRRARQGYARTQNIGGAISPLLSPNGRWLVYASRHIGQSGWRLRDHWSGEERWLLFPIERDIQDGMNINGSLPGAAFFPDSSAILVSMDGGIWRIDVPSGEKHPIQFEVRARHMLGPLTRYQKSLPQGPIELSRVAHPQFSLDGATIAFTALDKIWTMDVREGVPRRLTRSAEAIERHPHWSPDGRYLVYSSWDAARGGHVYRQRFGAAFAPVKLTERPARYLLPAYTPDGKSIVVTRDAASEAGAVGIFDLLVLPREGGAEKFLTSIAAGRQPFLPTFGETLALHFVRAAPGKVFFTAAEHGFIAVDLQSGKRCTVAKFGGAVEGLDYEPSAYAGYELVPNGDGRTALLRLGRHVYRISLDNIDLDACGDPRVVELGYPQSSLTMERLSRDGGLYPGWTAAGSAFYALGPTIYQHAPGGGHEIPRRSSVFDLSDDRPTQHRVVNITLERDAPKGTLMLRHVRIVTMRGDEIIKDGAILIAGNRIVALGPASQVAAPPDAAILDLHGMTITPGFIDTHCHVREPRFETSPGKQVPWELMNTLAYGVTTCADPYGSPLLLEMRDRIDAGSFVASRLVVSGEGLTWQEVLRNVEEAGVAVQRDIDVYRTSWTKYYVTGHRLQQQWIAMAAHQRRQSLNSEGLYFAYDIASVLMGSAALLTRSRCRTTTMT